jgi:hypothetical protein
VPLTPFVLRGHGPISSYLYALAIALCDSFNCRRSWFLSLHFIPCNLSCSPLFGNSICSSQPSAVL